jgi:hypothetical protein
MEVLRRSQDSQSTNGLLLYFIADVLRKPRLLEEFLAHPDAVVKRYDLNDEQIGALFSLNAAVIAATVQVEVAANVRRATSFDYPVPEVSIDEVSPLQIPTETLTTVTLTGEALMSHATVLFTNEADQRQFSFQGVDGGGAFQERTVDVPVTLPPGSYVISLRNSPDASAVTAEDKLTVA